jgi:hypothetical protein
VIHCVTLITKVAKPKTLVLNAFMRFIFFKKIVSVCGYIFVSVYTNVVRVSVYSCICGVYNP